MILEDMLMRAVRSGDWARVFELIEMGADIESPGPGGRGLLHMAIHWDDQEFDLDRVRRLISLGADVNRNSGLGTPLNYAVQKRDDPGLVQLLLNSGADPNTRATGKDRFLPIHCVAKSDKADIARMLVKFGSHVNVVSEFGYTPLLIAVMNGSVATAKVLLEAGADVSIEGDEQATAGTCPLLEAVNRNSKEMVRLLIAAGANVHACDNHGYGIIHRAAGCGYPEMVRLCIELGADLEAKTNGVRDTGGTPMFMFVPFCARGDFTNCQHDSHANSFMLCEILKILIDAGAEVNTRDERGWTPLMRFAHLDRAGVVRLLLDSGADPLLESHVGDTALSLSGSNECHHAIRAGIERRIGEAAFAGDIMG